VSRTEKFPGFETPSYTPVPKDLVDYVLDAFQLTESELKVLLYLIHRIFGWTEHRRVGGDHVSISQLLEGIVCRNGTRLDFGTGLTKKSLFTALNGLEQKGLVRRVRQADDRGASVPTFYSIHLRRPQALDPKTTGFNPFTAFNVPNEIFTRDLAYLTSRELRVLLFICRFAFIEDDGRTTLSFNRMISGVRRRDGSIISIGLDHRDLRRTLRSLEDQKRIQVLRRTGPHGAALENVYSLAPLLIVDSKAPSAIDWVGGEFTPPVRGDFTPPLGGEVTPGVGGENAPTVGGDFEPHRSTQTQNSQTPPPKQDFDPPISNGGGDNSPLSQQKVLSESPTDPKSTISKELAELFYKSLSLRVTSQKITKGEGEIQKLLEQGFTEDELRFAVTFIPKAFPDTKTIGRLPFLLDQALAQKAALEKLPPARSPQGTESAVPDEVRQARLEEHRKAFLALSLEEQQSYRSRVPKLLNLPTIRENWAIHEFARSTGLLTLGTER
jgi:DNA-binding MarR family transcriptional regulator